MSQEVILSVTPIMEDYLEAIAQLDGDEGMVRVSALSRKLNVSKPTVSEALRKLVGFGLVTHRRYGNVQLTGKGEAIAQQTQDKHNTLITFLERVLAVDSSVAQRDACKIEHSLSQETFQQLAQFVAFVESEACGNQPSWLKEFKQFTKKKRSK